MTAQEAHPISRTRGSRIVVGAFVCGAIAGMVFAVIGEGGVLIGAALQRSRVLFRAALLLSTVCVAARATLVVGP